MLVHICVGKLLMVFQDVAFLSPRASFSTAFLKNCGSGKRFGTTTCLKTVVGVSKGMLLVRYICSNKISFLCQSHFVNIIWPM